MFDNNRKEKSFEKVFKLTHPLAEFEEEKKCSNNAGNNLSSFYCDKKTSVKEGPPKKNPFLEIELSSEEVPNQIPDLEFSMIELKSPTYSSSYNSAAHENFFIAQKKDDEQRKILLKEEMKCPGFVHMKENISKLYHVAVKDNDENNVPTFFLKMPQLENKNNNIEDRKSFRNKVQQDINNELQDIYNGKFKIRRNCGERI